MEDKSIQKLNIENWKHQLAAAKRSGGSTMILFTYHTPITSDNRATTIAKPNWIVNAVENTTVCLSIFPLPNSKFKKREQALVNAALIRANIETNPPTTL